MRRFASSLPLLLALALPFPGGAGAPSLDGVGSCLSGEAIMAGGGTVARPGPADAGLVPRTALASAPGEGGGGPDGRTRTAPVPVRSRLGAGLAPRAAPSVAPAPRAAAALFSLPGFPAHPSTAPPAAA